MKRRLSKIEAEVSRREEAARAARSQQLFDAAASMSTAEVDALVKRCREAEDTRAFMEALTDAELAALCIRLDGDRDVQWDDITDEDLDRLSSEEITNGEMEAILDKYRTGGRDK